MVSFEPSLLEKRWDALARRVQIDYDAKSGGWPI